MFKESLMSEQIVSSNLKCLNHQTIGELMMRQRFWAKSADDPMHQEMSLRINNDTGEIVELGRKGFLDTKENEVNGYVDVLTNFKTGQLIGLDPLNFDDLSSDSKNMVEATIKRFNELCQANADKIASDSEESS